MLRAPGLVRDGKTAGGAAVLAWLRDKRGADERAAAAYAQRMLDEWCNPVDLIEPGIAFKRHPCCASTHRPVDALVSLRLDPAEVVRIETLVSEVAVANLRYREPQEVAEARFSLPYCLAAALHDGPLTPASFTPQAIRRTPVLDVLARTEMLQDPTQPASRPITETVEIGRVKVFLKDGTVREAEGVTPHGHPRDPLTDAELAFKFRACAAAGGLAPQAAERALDALGAFACLGEIGRLTRLLED
jgi:2-methylcitrate dehydratase PrpD